MKEMSYVFGTTSDNEAAVNIFDNDGNCLGFMVGDGSNKRGAIFEGWLPLGRVIVSGWANSETAMRKLEEHLQSAGYEPVGMDTPELSKPQAIWSRGLGTAQARSKLFYSRKSS